MARPSERARKKRLLFSIGLVLLLAVLIVAIRLVEEIGLDRKPSDRFAIARAVDGDTVELRGGDRLRLLAIDTPERGQPLYDEATRLLDSLTVGLTADIRFAGRRRDNYGRLLGYLFIDTLFVNRIILERGLGYLYLFDDNDTNSAEISRLKAAQRRALANKVGLWSLERTPEEFYVASERSFRFHRPGCRSVRDFKPGTYRTFATRDEALYEGLSPCRNCRP